jgi:hypothetical protein
MHFCVARSMSQMGQKRQGSERVQVFRFAPINGHRPTASPHPWSVSTKQSRSIIPLSKVRRHVVLPAAAAGVGLMHGSNPSRARCACDVAGHVAARRWRGCLLRRQARGRCQCAAAAPRSGNPRQSAGARESAFRRVLEGIRELRHPACRRREAQPGSCTERENLAGDAKGKGTSGSNREAESIDAPERLPCGGDEAV